MERFISMFGNMLSRKVIICRPYVNPLEATVYPFGIIRLEFKDEYTEAFVKALFWCSKHEYPFLKRHLHGRFWLLNKKALKFPSDPRIWAMVIPPHEVGELESQNYIAWKNYIVRGDVEAYKETLRIRWQIMEREWTLRNDHDRNSTTHKT